MAATTAAVVGAAAAAKGAYDQRKGAKESLAAQEDQNASNEAFLREQYGKGRQDVLKYVPQGAEAAQKAYEQAYGVANQAGRQRLDAVTNSNMGAQATLLAGLPQMNNALMGAPVDLSGLQPQGTGVDSSLYDGMSFSPDMIPNALAGASESLQQAQTTNSGGYAYNITPGQTTNKQLVDQAYAGGDLSESDYKWFQRYLANSPDDDLYWATLDEPHESLVPEALAGLAPDNRARVNRIIGLVKQYGGAA